MLSEQVLSNIRNTFDRKCRTFVSSSLQPRVYIALRGGDIFSAQETVWNRLPLLAPPGCRPDGAIGALHVISAHQEIKHILPAFKSTDHRVRNVEQ